MRVWLVLALVGLMLVPAAAHAKKFRYASGPKAPEDTVFSVSQADLQPIVRSRGPRVPVTNLQMVGLVARAGFDRGLASAPVDTGTHVILAPAESHPLNFVIEHSILRHLANRGVTATVRRTIIPDDSLAVVGGATADPVLEYQLASARVTYLRLVGWLPGRVKIERQALVEGGLTLRDPRDARVLWSGDASYNLVDAFPRSSVPLVEDPRYTDLKSEVPQRNVDKVIEPVIVVGVVAGLVALFFQNRP